MTRPFPDGGGWRGVDLDGTLAYYDGWKGAHHIGEPVPKMLERVLRWLEAGHQVAIVTARVAYRSEYDDPHEVDTVRQAIEAWCKKHLGQVIPITNEKDYGMFELWDDRAIQVIPNTGERVDGSHDAD